MATFLRSIGQLYGVGTLALILGAPVLLSISGIFFLIELLLEIIVAQKYRCKNCDMGIPLSALKFRYCPYCGHVLASQT